jgi:CRISPR-associated protein Csb2
MTHLLLTVQLLDDRYHGLLARNGPPEWPPSPFRLFCALVAGVAQRGELEGEIRTALEWLQELDPPIIIAPNSKEGRRFTRFVPNNDGDKKPDRQERLAAKLNIPTFLLLGQDGRPRIHYLWDISGRTEVPLDRIRDASRSLVALGWGVDMAFADAKLVTDADIQKLAGVRWHPKHGMWRNEGMLRVPTVSAELQECTLSNLMHCHQTATARIEHGQPLHNADNPRVYEQVFYTSAEGPLVGRPWRVFELRNTDGSRFRYPHRKLLHIAGMVRHLAIAAMEKDPPRDVAGDWVETYVAGHAKTGFKYHRQLSFLPLPSVGHEYTDPGVRRVIVAAPVGDDAWLDHVVRRLAGQALKPEPDIPDPFADREPPILVPMPRQSHDGVVRCYTGPASVWHSFTPVILPGHDDHKPEKTWALIERALRQSGIDQACEFEWSVFSRFANSYSAHKYDEKKRPQGYFRPSYLNGLTAVHLTLRFTEDLRMPGPLVIGAGRHCGFGLMAHFDQAKEGA